MSSSALLAWALAGPAQAGACCVASTSGVPDRLGECETWLVGLGVGGEAGLGRWDSEAQPTDSSLEEQSVVGAELPVALPGLGRAQTQLGLAGVGALLVR